MKSRVIYTFFALIFIAIVTMSNSAGRASTGNEGGTLAPGDGTYCGTCHTGGNFGTSIDMKLFEQGTSTEVTSYVPGATYDVEITISTNSAPTGYGFQALALKDADNSSINNWINASTASTQLTTTTSGRQYFEHNSIASDNVFQAEWTAPAAGEGNVTFYMVGNAVNATSSTAGDEVAANSVTITETLVNSKSLTEVAVQMNLFPNPTVENLTLDFTAAEVKDLTVNIYNQNGQRVLNRNVVAQNGENRLVFSVNDYVSGVYFVEVTDGAQSTVKRFVKL